MIVLAGKFRAEQALRREAEGILCGEIMKRSLRFADADQLFASERMFHLTR